MLNYLQQMTLPRFVLWCYLIWWCGAALPYFDPAPRLWVSSFGIAMIIGTGLYLSTAYASTTRTQLNRWAIARLYMMPFFVSSFAALIKGRGFFLVFHPDAWGNLKPFLACLAFGLIVATSRIVSPRMARPFVPKRQS